MPDDLGNEGVAIFLGYEASGGNLLGALFLCQNFTKNTKISSIFYA